MPIHRKQREFRLSKCDANDTDLWIAQRMDANTEMVLDYSRYVQLAPEPWSASRCSYMN